MSLLLAVVIHMLWIVIPHADHCYSCASSVRPNMCIIISRKPPCTASSWEMKRRPPSPSLSRRSRKRRRRVKSALSILIPPRPEYPCLPYSKIKETGNCRGKPSEEDIADDQNSAVRTVNASSMEELAQIASFGVSA